MDDLAWIEWFKLQFVALARERPRLPCVKGKRSAVAVVNDSPVGCQSRDRVARRQLSKISDF